MARARLLYLLLALLGASGSDLSPEAEGEASPLGCLSKPEPPCPSRREAADAFPCCACGLPSRCWPGEPGLEPSGRVIDGGKPTETTGPRERIRQPLAFAPHWLIWLGISLGLLLTAVLCQGICYCCTKYWWRTRPREEETQEIHPEEAGPASRLSESDRSQDYSPYESLSSSSEEDLQIVPV